MSATVTAWRDYEREAADLPGMFLGELDAAGPAAEAADRLWRAGARRVRLPGPVDLRGPHEEAAAWQAVRALCLVRDLTAAAVYVEWDLRLPRDGDGEAWRTLCHLQPPMSLTGPPDPEGALATWRDQHYLCKCLWRQGPGFVQIRDRRWDALHRFTVPEPEYREAIGLLVDGARADAVPKAVLDDFRAERLVGEVGPLVWWLPYRVRRWIQEAMAI
ncbi:hypothetical protein I3F58_05600 [Streptomyces sp. MUM 203J]|uniref:DUF5825 family protein n=1 Tax=Streptomyces sp. MUM 203J TaxID=2791990 RepID=UPI001F050206|nr:DUF5825 family protein [Streptomyces sp. MUM 203J]MCH0539039.1 hypothetical protein [Streptomyces sp. MUM 203J]